MSTFSERGKTEREPNSLARALERARAKKIEFFDLTGSNPTIAGLRYPSEKILEALGAAGALDYEPEPFGLLSAREAVAADLESRGCPVSPSRIVLTSSTSEAYSFLFKLLCDDGDEVLAPRPSYPLFEHLAQFEGVRLSRYGLAYDGAWHLDVASLGRAKHERARAVLTVSPNNPTGSYTKKEELERIVDLGLPIISDEVFGAYGFRDDPMRSTTALEAESRLVFSLGGLSKQAGLPQLKLAWIAVGGPDKLVDEALARLELIADTYLSPATPVQRALPRLLEISGSVHDQIRLRIRSNLFALHQAIDEDSPATVLRVEGGWYAIVRLPTTSSEEKWVLRLLEEKQVVVQPGWFYDFRSEAYVVMSLLTPEGVFREGANRLAALVGA